MMIRSLVAIPLLVLGAATPTRADRLVSLRPAPAPARLEFIPFAQALSHRDAAL